MSSRSGFPRWASVLAMTAFVAVLASLPASAQLQFSSADGKQSFKIGILREHSRPEQRIFVGVVDPIDPRVESPEEIRDRVLEAAEFIAPERLGTTDDCGFSPFGDDLSTARDTAFAKIRARVLGTAMAERELA